MTGQRALRRTGAERKALQTPTQSFASAPAKVCGESALNFESFPMYFLLSLYITLLRLQRARTMSHYTQGAATLYPGLCVGCPFRALLLIFVHQTVHPIIQVLSSSTSPFYGNLDAHGRIHVVSYRCANPVTQFLHVVERVGHAQAVDNRFLAV